MFSHSCTFLAGNYGTWRILLWATQGKIFKTNPFVISRQTLRINFPRIPWNCEFMNESLENKNKNYHWGIYHGKLSERIRGGITGIILGEFSAVSGKLDHCWRKYVFVKHKFIEKSINNFSKKYSENTLKSNPEELS